MAARIAYERASAAAEMQAAAARKRNLMCGCDAWLRAVAGGDIPGPDGNFLDPACAVPKVFALMPPPLTLEEEQAKLRPNSLKAHLFDELRKAGPDGLLVAEAAAKVAARHPSPPAPKKSVQAALTQDASFVRIGAQRLGSPPSRSPVALPCSPRPLPPFRLLCPCVVPTDASPLCSPSPSAQRPPASPSAASPA